MGDLVGQSEIAAVTQLQLRRLAPEPDWQARASALANALEEAAPGQKLARSVLLVAPPFSGLCQPLGLLAERYGWQVIEPPEDLLMSPDAAAVWWDRQPLDQPWVIPELAKFWLRNYAGLAAIRELLNRVASDQCAPGVVGCSSWCWSFWQRYLPDLPVTVQTLAPMGAEELAVWLESLPGNASRPPLRVRMANNNDWVIPLKDRPALGAGRHSTYLKDLAALSRGNPGVALAIWQRALRARPDDAQLAGDGEAASPTGTATRDCWVIPLEQVSLPEVSTVSRPMTSVLHSILLHAGLTTDRLALVTALTSLDVLRALRWLERYELVANGEDGWQVTAQAYPWIRRQLQGEGYPVDGF
ncbi:hypothetical protein [Marinobacter sp. SS21]|uniref:hypothetical protein n=1 Tax=Marinobacter sp. SS21 TaxID=2979460 RepID=UPI00232DF577|nr:hypothetical protein [Marinobacter sp. SS21]MDC0661618.1 hypothetical protein [Marinobacter sp. SS21]